MRLDREKRLLALQLSSAKDQAQQQRLQWEDTRSSEKSSRDLLMSELLVTTESVAHLKKLLVTETKKSTAILQRQQQVLYRYSQTACMLTWSQVIESGQKKQHSYTQVLDCCASQQPRTVAGSHVSMSPQFNMHKGCLSCMPVCYQGRICMQ